MTDDFLRARLDQMIDRKHPLAVLAGRLPWAQLEAALAPAFARKSRDGRIVEGSDLFGTTLEIAGVGVSAAGRPRLSIRLMASLLYLRRKLDTATTESPLTRNRLATLMERAERIRTQQPKDKNKLYALHAPEVECIGKGKARKPYEFGVKASIAVTHQSGLIVGARTFPGNPYDGHVLNEQLEQTTILLEDTGKAPKQVIVDLGYRGVDKDNPTVEIIHRGKYKSLTKQQRRWLKRRQAVEPAIGHLKSDHRMDRCWLQGQLGDALHAVLCAAGYNLRWLLRAMVRLGLKALLLRPLFLSLMAPFRRHVSFATCYSATAASFGVADLGLR